MPVVVHSLPEIAALRRAGKVAAKTLATVGAKLRAGITTKDIDRWVREDTRARGAKPSQLGYHGFPGAVCTSRNHVVCHGIPNDNEELKDGDIINVDVTSELDGFHGDLSETFVIGDRRAASSDALLVVDVAQKCLAAGIAAVRPGARLGDIGEAIESLARAYGCGTVREFGGHGIGRAMHMEPHVPHYGERGKGLRLRAGMAFTIEPMITIGDPKIVVLDDGWTAVTDDGSPSAQFEHTIVVTEHGAEVMTL